MGGASLHQIQFDGSYFAANLSSHNVFQYSGTSCDITVSKIIHGPALYLLGDINTIFILDSFTDRYQYAVLPVLRFCLFFFLPFFFFLSLYVFCTWLICWIWRRAKQAKILAFLCDFTCAYYVYMGSILCKKAFVLAYALLQSFCTARTKKSVS